MPGGDTEPIEPQKGQLQSSRVRKASTNQSDLESRVDHGDNFTTPNKARRCVPQKNIALDHQIGAFSFTCGLSMTGGVAWDGGELMAVDIERFLIFLAKTIG